MRRIIIAVILFVGILFVISNFAEFKNIISTLQRGNWLIILLALIAQLFWYAAVAAGFKAIYWMLGMPVQHLRLLRLAIAGDFMNIVLPSVGLSGVSVFISDAQQRGQSPARAAVAGALYTLFDYIAFLCFLVAGMVVLIKRNDLSWGEIVASIYLLLVAIGLCVLLYLGMRSAAALGTALVWLAHRVNRILFPFIKRNYMSEEHARSFAHDAAEGIHILRRQPKLMIWPVLFAITSKSLLVAILTLSFLAFQVPFSAGTIIASFSTSYLFLIISPTPAGVGVFEGAMTLSLTSLHVTLADAAVITLTYRAVTFWFPLLLGFIVVRGLNQSNKPKIDAVTG
jgi:uncharacterized protein (TIRG00374 family)